MSAARSLLCACGLLVAAASVVASADTPPQIKAAALSQSLAIDGRLDESAWASAEAIDGFLQVDPTEGAPPTARTVVRVLASAQALVIGIVCEDAEPAKILSFSVRRDAPLGSEDRIRGHCPFLTAAGCGRVNPAAPHDGPINLAVRQTRTDGI